MFATGFIAVGQVATGVIAIGQVARGAIAIGQVSIGLWSIGMGAAGLFWAGGMLGVGGRGFGIVLPLVPRLGPSAALPEAQPLTEVQREGWVRARVYVDEQGPCVAVDGVGLRYVPGLVPAMKRRAASGSAVLLAHVTRRDSGPVVDRLMEIPTPRWRAMPTWITWGVQSALLLALAMAVVVLVGVPVLVGVRDAIVLP